MKRRTTTLVWALLLVWAASVSWMTSVPGRLEAANDVLTGTVKDEAGKPLRAAAITATQGNVSVSRYTDATGRYEITGLAPGKYTVTATAWAYDRKNVEKVISGATTADFSLAPKWDPHQISSAEYISAYGEEPGIQRIENTCTGCHNLSWLMKRKGMAADQWVDFIPNMGTAFVTPRYEPKVLAELGEILEKYWGPDSKMPTREQVQHLEVSDEALRATFRMYKPPTRNMAHSLHMGADGKAWFTQFDNFSNKIASFDPATQEFREYEIPTPRAGTHNPWVARDGRVWITENAAGKLAVLEPATGLIVEYPVPNRAAHTLREDSKGYIWTTTGGRSARFDPRTKEFTTYEAGGYDLAVDSKGNAWATQTNAASVMRIDGATGAIKKYPVPGTTFMRGIEVDGQDNVWFGDVTGHRLGRIDQKTDEITYFKPPTQNFGPYGIAIDKRTGHIWAADYLGANLTRFDPRTGQFMEFPTPSRTTMMRFFALDANGRPWYTDFAAGSVVVMETGEPVRSTRQ